MPFPAREVEGFKWKDGPGPTYSKDESIYRITLTYDNTLRTIKRILPELGKQNEFLGLLKRLKQEGWLDWHILSALANIIYNYELKQNGIDMNDREACSKFYTDMIFGERNVQLGNIPLKEFEEENIRFSLKTGSVNVLRRYNLVISTRTPNMDGILELLKRRYFFFEDDVPHTDILELFTRSGN
jgi:hypothetical protein